MIDTLLVDRTPRQTRLALLAGGRTVEVWAERPDDPRPRVADVYLCRVTDRADAMGGVFVDLGGGDPGFLRDRTLRQGDQVLAQVAAEAHGGKGPRLTRRVALAGRTAVRALADRLPATGGVTLRTMAAGVPDDVVAAELARLAADAQALLAAARATATPGRVWPAPPGPLRALRDHAGIGRVVVSSGEVRAWCRRLTDPEPWAGTIAWEVAREGAGLFESLGVEAAIERALEPRVAIAGGVELAITAGPGLTAIDVDSARASDRSAVDCDLAAARVIPAEIRLRGLEGLIVVDFIGLEGDGVKRRVMAELRAGLADDRQVTASHGLSPLGLAEIARRRGGAALVATMMEPCLHCAGGLWISAAALADAVARRIAREAASRPGGMTVVCAAEVANALADPRQGGVAALEALAGGPLTIRPDPQVRRDTIDVARTRA